VKKLIIISIFLVGGLLAGFYKGPSAPSMLSQAKLRMLGALLGVAFLAMGAYGLASGRVYGRSLEKYLGGWISRSENPNYFRAYTLMYLIVGLLILLGCSIVRF
jgi:hypothetical protein